VVTNLESLSSTYWMAQRPSMLPTANPVASVFHRLVPRSSNEHVVSLCLEHLYAYYRLIVCGDLLWCHVSRSQVNHAGSFVCAAANDFRAILRESWLRTQRMSNMHCISPSTMRNSILVLHVRKAPFLDCYPARRSRICAPSCPTRRPLGSRLLARKQGLIYCLLEGSRQ